MAQACLPTRLFVISLTFFFLQYNIMTLVRTPLGLLNDNSRRRELELSLNKRGEAFGLIKTGQSEAQAARELKASRQAIRTTKKLANLNTNSESLARSSRLRVYNERDNRTILYNLRLFSKSTYNKRRHDTNLLMSNSYIKRIASAIGLYYQYAKKRPELTDKVATERLLQCYVRVHQTVEDWRKYIWSDEYSTEKGKG